MSVNLKFVQNQDYEGFKATHLQADGSALDISTLSECVFRIFKQDYSAIEFTGSYTGGKVTFLTTGADGIVIFTPAASDMSNSGVFKGEVETTLGGKKLKKQEFQIKIDKESPTT